uniref:RNase H type-1 domain-containing protein n=1 Tax=Quercus lobata TaxID=97700 RepID=A0A7N2MA99_QUELO
MFALYFLILCCTSGSCPALPEDPGPLRISGLWQPLVWNVKQMTDDSLASMIKNDMEELGRRTTAQIARWTKDYLEEFQTANHRPQHFQHQQTTSWSLPHPQWYKINVDGAIFESLNEVGIGVIIRDHYGLVTA